MMRIGDEMLSANENIGIKPDEIKNDIVLLSSIQSELDGITKQVYSSFSDVKADKKGVDVDFFTDTQESMIENIQIHNNNVSYIIETLKQLVASYQEENDELIRNVTTSKPNQ